MCFCSFSFFPTEFLFFHVSITENKVSSSERPRHRIELTLFQILEKSTCVLMEFRLLYGREIFIRYYVPVSEAFQFWNVLILLDFLLASEVFRIFHINFLIGKLAHATEKKTSLVEIHSTLAFFSVSAFPFVR